MVSFQVSGQPALRFKVAARAVLFAGSRRGQVEQPVCRALVERFRRHGFGFFVGCATGVDAAFRAALAHSACGPEEVFVGCTFGQRARRCRAEGLFASAVVPEGIPPRAALARRTLWLVKRSSLVVLFPERPADRQWGPGRWQRYLSRHHHPRGHHRPTVTTCWPATSAQWRHLRSGKRAHWAIQREREGPLSQGLPLPA